MVSKSKGDYAYTILDISEKATEDMAAALSAIDGVVRVRIVK